MFNFYEFEIISDNKVDLVVHEKKTTNKFIIKIGKTLFSSYAKLSFLSRNKNDIFN